MGLDYECMVLPALTCLQSKCILLCKQSCLQMLYIGITTAILIQLSQSSWKQEGSNFKMATVNVALNAPIEYSCSNCGKSFTERRNLLRHIDKHHPDKVANERLECQLCHQKFKRRDNLTYHKRNYIFRTSGKRDSVNQVGGGKMKRP